MNVRAILTDLDGTLLEPDGRLIGDGRTILRRLVSAGVPVCPISSKTAVEIGVVRDDLGLSSPAGFENGAGVLRGDGSTELGPAAVAVDRLQTVLDELRRVTGAPIRSIGELTDSDVAQLTGLDGPRIRRARLRLASLPLVVAETWDDELRSALPEEPRLRLVRGNRFLHLQGAHDKADVVPVLLGLVADTGGIVVCCGDAPNDVGLLRLADVAVIVPSRFGPHPELANALPDAIIAPHPHGRGWAAAIGALLAS